MCSVEMILQSLLWIGLLEISHDKLVIFIVSLVSITERVVPACLPMESDQQHLMEQRTMWTAGLGAINSVRSPGGEIHHIFPFQMKETQLEIQVF